MGICGRKPDRPGLLGFSAPLLRMCCQQSQQMPAKDQARGQCNDHYRNVVELAGTVGAAVENNRDKQHNEAYSQPATGLDNTHGAAPRAQSGACTTGIRCSLSTHNRWPLDDRHSSVENFFGLAGPWWIDALTVDGFLYA